MQLKQFYNIATKVSSRKKCYYFWWSTWLFSYGSEIGWDDAQYHEADRYKNGYAIAIFVRFTELWHFPW